MAAGIALLASAVAGTIVAVPAAPAAYAAEYPSWQDVQNARSSVAAAEAQITQIRDLIQGLQADVDNKNAIAEQKGAEFQDAQQAFDDAAYKADQLQTQADDAAERAESSRRQAGQLAAQLARAGGGDLSANLFANPGQADELLSKLGYASKVSEQAEGLYAKALQEKNTAQSLTDQANVARQIREQLRIVAEAALAEANAAAEAAAAALAAQQEHQVELEAQLTVLVENRAATEADYQKGVEARAAAARAAAAASASALGGTPGFISPSGWTWPSNGRITSPYGYRVHPKYGTWRLHSGTDMAGGCGIPIYAAHSGVVTYSGRYGTYGNFVLLDNGGGISTGYAHIVDGGLLVRVGDYVDAGTAIARVGTTGASTGCHLHYEVRINGTATDAVAFMRDQGVPVG